MRELAITCVLNRAVAMLPCTSGQKRMSACCLTRRSFTPPKNLATVHEPLRGRARTSLRINY